MLLADVAVTGEESSPYAIPESDAGLAGEGPIRRYDWFRNLWEGRRSAWAKTIEQDQGAVVFLGDSIMQGWGDGLGPAFPGIKVANRGISGDTSRGVLIRLHEDVFALKPSAIVLLIGTNDIEEKAAPDLIARNVKLIIDTINDYDSQLPIIFCDVFPSSESMGRPTELIQEINSYTRSFIDDYAQIIRLDTFALFDDGQGNAKPAEFPDLLHPNEIGYAKWAEALRPILAQLQLPQIERQRQPQPQ